MDESGTKAAFATTHWSVVLAAGDTADSGSQAALAQLCQTYWYPLYAHARRRGHDPENARDLTQGFFEQLLARNAVELADPQRGRFRTFLLGALDHFLHHVHRDATTLKRGGGREFVSWDAHDAEEIMSTAKPVRPVIPKPTGRHSGWVALTRDLSQWQVVGTYVLEANFPEMNRRWCAEIHPAFGKREFPLPPSDHLRKHPLMN